MGERMELTKRIRNGFEADAVPRAEVARRWLANEVDPSEDDPPNPNSTDDEERLIAELVDRKPIAASVFRTRDLDWYRLPLSVADLADLRVVKGPPDEGWRAVAHDGLVETVAFRMFETEPVDRLDRAVPPDLIEVLDMADDLSSSGSPEELVVVEERAGEPPYVADGNHTAVAQLLHALRGEEYPGQEAYVGVRPETVDG